MAAFLSTTIFSRLRENSVRPLAQLRQKYGIRSDYDRYSDRNHLLPASETTGQPNLFWAVYESL
jgi:hypothetical protein